MYQIILDMMYPVMAAIAICVAVATPTQTACVITCAFVCSEMAMVICQIFDIDSYESITNMVCPKYKALVFPMIHVVICAINYNQMCKILDTARVNERMAIIVVFIPMLYHCMALRKIMWGPHRPSRDHLLLEG
jgi:hypothetical protein